jgi:hypothetical protein
LKTKHSEKSNTTTESFDEDTLRGKLTSFLAHAVYHTPLFDLLRLKLLAGGALPAGTVATQKWTVTPPRHPKEQEKKRGRLRGWWGVKKFDTVWTIPMA